jgi:8-oxo-dGTP pyrophosphatase MutT (NUDIX family)
VTQCGFVDDILWFDDRHSHAAAGVFMRTPDRRLILQLRDDIPGIDNPGMITSFGGGAEPGETPIACALRELEEETGLRRRPADLRFLASLSKTDFRGNVTACVFYTLEAVDPDSLVVTEGQPILLTLHEVAADPRTTMFCRQLCARIAAQEKAAPADRSGTVEADDS